MKRLVGSLLLGWSLAAHGANDDAALQPTIVGVDGQQIKVIKCYPDGRMRAYCPNFDDGRLEYDSYIIKTLRDRKMTGTFFVNTLHEQSRQAMQHPDEYAGFEVASHGAHHKGLKGMPLETARAEIATDIQNIKEKFDQKVEGFAYPYGAIPDDPAEVEKMMTDLGIIYARGTRANGRYLPPEKFLRWDPAAPMGSDFPKHWDKFLLQPANDEVRVLMHFGHAIDFDRGNISKENWEQTLDRIAADKSIWNVTMLEFARYIMALRTLEISRQGVGNKSAVDLWVKIGDKAIEIKAGSHLDWAALNLQSGKS
jgi:peptidoglycan/xylan/chitin deacetylase (PgdA/CDA1 family)